LFRVQHYNIPLFFQEKQQIEAELRLTQSELSETEFQLANLQEEHHLLLGQTSSFDREREVNGEVGSRK
jgi:hypothetical protein